MALDLKIMPAIQRMGQGLGDAISALFQGPEAAPPVGAQQTFGGVQPGTTLAAPAAIGGSGLLLILLGVFLLSRMKG